MKKCFSKMFTLFVATVLGISSGYVFSAEKGQNMSREELVQARIEQLKAMNKPILFFGKVVDQFEKPVVGAAVVAGIAKIDPENPNAVSGWISVKEFRVTTDGDGLFDLKGHGTSLHINKIELPGYELDLLAEPTTFKYSRYEGGEIHSPAPSKPVVIHLRKKGKPVFMAVSMSKIDFRFRLDPEKQPEKGIYLVKPWLTETGQEGILPRGKTLKLNDRRKDETDLKFVAEWTADACVIRFLPQLTSSGIIVTDELLYEAPESGYEQEGDFRIQLPAPYEVRKHLYVKSEDGRYYSRIDVVISVRSKNLVNIAGVVCTNATGPRNLEYNALYQREEYIWRREMNALRSASKRTREEYVKKYKLKRAPGLKEDGKFDKALFREDIKKLKAMRDKENPRWWHKFDKTR